MYTKPVLPTLVQETRGKNSWRNSKTKFKTKMKFQIVLLFSLQTFKDVTSLQLYLDVSKPVAEVR